MMMNVLRICFVAVVIGTALACAATPPAKSLQPGDVKQLAGKWTGWMTTTQGNASAEIVLNEDGKFVALFGAQQASGTVEIRDGKAAFTSPTVVGTLTLHERDGKPFVRVDGRLTQMGTAFWGELTK